jgi:hypothetical protein
MQTVAHITASFAQIEYLVKIMSVPRSCGLQIHSILGKKDTFALVCKRHQPLCKSILLSSMKFANIDKSNVESI